MWSSVANARNTFMPPTGTELAGKIDSLYEVWLIASVISFVLVVGGMIWFVVKYRRQTADQKSAYISHNHALEFLWSFIPLVIFMGLFGWGWALYHEMRSTPEDALEVHVVAKKWAWRFIYKNGKEEAGLDGPPTMVVPVGRAVKLIMMSDKINPSGNDPTDKAVLHSFFVPAFRIKQDLVPGRYTTVGFKAQKVGDYHLFCTEYCGTGHSKMLGIVKVVPKDEFETWLSTEEVKLEGLAGVGKKLYVEKACVGCHNLDGKAGNAGPTYKGLWGQEHEIEGGGKVKVDENYLRESILQSNAKIVKGYPKGIMPVYAGQLSEDDVAALIAFIKTVK